MFKKIIPYHIKSTKNSFKKFEGFYYKAFVWATIIICFFLLIPIVSGGHYFSAIFPVIFILIAYSNFMFTEIDYVNKRYKEAYYFLGKEYRKWKAIPKMKYLAIFHVRKDYEQIAYEDEPIGIFTEYHSELRIVFEKYNHIVLLEFNCIKTAKKQSSIIAKGLNEKLIM